MACCAAHASLTFLPTPPPYRIIGRLLAKREALHTAKAIERATGPPKCRQKPCVCGKCPAPPNDWKGKCLAYEQFLIMLSKCPPNAKLCQIYQLFPESAKEIKGFQPLLSIEDIKQKEAVEVWNKMK